MQQEPIIDYLAGITDLSPGFTVDLLACLNRERYKAHQIIQSVDQTQMRFWYLFTGLARSYIFGDQEQEHTLMFWHPGEVIFSYAGFLKEPSTEYIELLTDSELYSCTYAQLQELMNKHREAIKIAGEINRRFLEKDHKRNQLHALKTKVRYQLFRKEHPEVFAQVPQLIIASYLHMTRENLSRIISGE